MSTKLKTDRREGLGTRQARKQRAAGKLPATLQAADGKPHFDLIVDEEEFLASRRRHQHLYELEIEGGTETALVRHLTWDVFGERILNIEFRRVDRAKKTRVEVELEFTGHPKSGVLNHLLTHVTVITTPDRIPDSLEVSIADLTPGTSILASEIKLPEGVELALPAETPVGRITVVKIIEAAPAPAAAPVEGAAAAAPGAAPAAGAPGAAPAAAGAAAPGKAAAPGEEKGGKEKKERK